jgi:hypothetical protein
MQLKAEATNSNSSSSKSCHFLLGPFPGLQKRSLVVFIHSSVLLTPAHGLGHYTLPTQIKSTQPHPEPPSSPKARTKKNVGHRPAQLAFSASSCPGQQTRQRSAAQALPSCARQGWQDVCALRQVCEVSLTTAPTPHPIPWACCPLSLSTLLRDQPGTSPTH